MYQTMQLPLHEIVKRKSSRWSRSAFADNDNNEIKVMSNTIFTALGYSDTARNMGYTSVYQKCLPEEEGIEIVIFPQERMPEMLEEMHIIILSRKG